jgi:hypothetical protein
MIQVVGKCCAFADIVVAFSESANYTSYRIRIGGGMPAVAAAFI